MKNEIDTLIEKLEEIANKELGQCFHTGWRGYEVHYENDAGGHISINEFDFEVTKY